MKKLIFSIILCFLALIQTNNINATGAWNGGDPKAFISQGLLDRSPTQLTVVTYNSDGSINLNEVGDTSHNVIYNALAFNTTDNYLYALVKDVIKTPTKPVNLKAGDIVRIANDGSLEYVTHVTGNPADNTAAGANAASYNPDDNGYYVWRDNLGGSNPQYTSLFRVSLDDGSITNVGALSQRSRAQDFTYLNGYFWALQRDVNNTKKANLVKVDPTNAQTTIIPLTDLALDNDGPQFGAA